MPPLIWHIRSISLDLTSHAILMGILNVTPDSFSDGGNFFSTQKAIEHGLKMLEDGATILDIGGESTRPGSEPVSLNQELERVLPVVEGILRHAPNAILSMDTTKAKVAEEALLRGAAIINDVSALRADPEMLPTILPYQPGIVLMHMLGTPKTMQIAPQYQNVCEEVANFLGQQFHSAVKSGIRADSIVLDPGIGFGKSLQHNLMILQNLPKFMINDRPLLLGISRKSMIAHALGVDSPEFRLQGTLALTSLARMAGVRIHRVHDVAENLQVLRMTEAILPPTP